MKLRADLLLVQQGLAESRTQAQKLILAGLVRAGADHLIASASDLVDEQVPLQVAAPLAYVSRGAEKLLPALDRYLPSLAGLVALDLGASTGGFTDLMLQRGAVRVYAIDVGHGQLHWKLRQDPRVICHEKVNARYLTREQVPEPVDVLTADLSFISLTKVLPAAAPLLRPGGWAFTLVKPQFEAQRHEIDKGGVVRDDAIRQRVVAEIVAFATTALGWQPQGVLPSPLLGPKGNQEFVAVFRAAAG
jgi:23S rRNA (cytidine1920-2'-O)/16S rRNA (cytidine1409-2'-O)-methyltransferase